MHQTRKGNQWHFGMKAHIGVDVASGVVHSLVGTAANEADINQTAALLHGQETDVFADAGYTGADKRPEHADRDVAWNIAIKRGIIKALPKALRDLAEPVERALAQVRAWVGAPVPHRQEPVPAQEAALSRPQEEHRAATYSVRAGQLGDRQENAAGAEPCLSTPGLCLDPEIDTAKPQYAPCLLPARPLPAALLPKIMPSPPYRRAMPPLFGVSLKQIGHRSSRWLRVTKRAGAGPDR
jgi:hypothetical protein